MTAKPPAAGDHIRDIAPKLADLTRDVLFGDVWERPQLKKRDRSLATVTALIAMNRLEQLPGHMTRALANGVTKEEIIELITHLAFYSGWPNSMSALIDRQQGVRPAREGLSGIDFRDISAACPRVPCGYPGPLTAM